MLNLDDYNNSKINRMTFIIDLFKGDFNIFVSLVKFLYHNCIDLAVKNSDVFFFLFFIS